MGKPLIQRRKDIKAKMIERIENASITEPKLNPTVIGKKTKRDKFKPPFIWLIIDENIENESFNISEKWTTIVRVLAIIKDHNPVEGKDRAETLAIEAASAIQYNGPDNDRTLDGLVRIVSKTAFISGEDQVIDQDPTLWGSVMVLQMDFTNKEVI